MTPAGNTTRITIKKGTLIHLFLGDAYVGPTACTKPDTYTVNEIRITADATDTRYARVYDTVQNYRWKLYDRWVVWASQLK